MLFAPFGFKFSPTFAPFAALHVSTSSEFSKAKFALEFGGKSAFFKCVKSTLPFIKDASFAPRCSPFKKPVRSPNSLAFARGFCEGEYGIKRGFSPPPPLIKRGLFGLEKFSYALFALNSARGLWKFAFGKLGAFKFEFDRFCALWSKFCAKLSTFCGKISPLADKRGFSANINAPSGRVSECECRASSLSAFSFALGFLVFAWIILLSSLLITISFIFSPFILPMKILFSFFALFIMLGSSNT